MDYTSSLGAQPKSNDDKAALIIATSIVLIVVSFIGISFRLYARLIVLRKIFTEDILMVSGTLAAFGLSTVYIIGGYHGYGLPIHDISPADLTGILPSLSFATIFLWTLTMLLVKMSFLILYLRLDQRKAMRWTVCVLMFLVASQNIAFLIIQAVSCMPPSFLKVGEEDARRCWAPSNVQLSFNINSVCIAVLDAAILAVPICMLRSLELPTRQKYAVGALFALGILPIIAGCLRAYYTWHAINSSNPYYDLVEGGIWAQVELHLAILCGSASTFKVLLKGFCPSCCNNNDDEDTVRANSGADLQRQSVAEMTANAWNAVWTTGQVQVQDGRKSWLGVDDSPVSTMGSWRTLTPTPPPPALVEQETKEKQTLASRRLSRNLIVSRKGSSIAKMPADLQLRFPSIDGRLEGKRSRVEDATPSVAASATGTEKDGKAWSSTQPHAITTS